MSTEVLDQQVDADVEPLHVADRCDHGGCSAQAFVRANLTSGALLFCGHHYAANEAAIAEQGIQVDDFRHLINARASESSA